MSNDMRRFASLDSSHWVGLANSLREPHDRPRALARLDQLAATGWALVLTLHHISEILQYENEGVALARLSALRHVGKIATIATNRSRDGMGSVVEVHAEEVLCAAAHPEWNAPSLIQALRGCLFGWTTGDAIVDELMPSASLIRQHLLKQQQRSREIASLSQAKTLDQSSTPFSPTGQLRSAGDVAEYIQDLKQRLITEVHTRGDRRLTNPIATATVFVDDLADHSDAIGQSTDPVATILRTAGLTKKDVMWCRTLGDVGDMAVFKRNLLQVAANVGLTAAQVTGLRPDHFPTFMIQRSLQRHRAHARYAKGSDLTDSHLLSLSPYLDRTFVDRTTFENVRRIGHKEPQTKALLINVAKARNWFAALDSLTS